VFVELDKVSLRYGTGDAGTLALADATIGIEKGEFVAVVGPSGCGKSTLLKLVSGLHPATTGSVVVAGNKVTKPLPICGMAFQAATLLPWRTTLDNVLLPLEIVEQHAGAYRRDPAVRREGEAAAGDGRARRLRGEVSLAALGRHAAAHVAVPRADPRARPAAARRALRRARRVHARGALGHPADAVHGASVRPSS
jgi:ABC-type sugar transport system ATPase subunit